MNSGEQLRKKLSYPGGGRKIFTEVMVTGTGKLDY
jgi:hypothetical protein